MSVIKYNIPFEETDALSASLRSDYETLTSILDDMLPSELTALIQGAERLGSAARTALVAQGGARPDAVEAPTNAYTHDQAQFITPTVTEV